MFCKSGTFCFAAYIYNKMSSYQRAKIESFFGKMNAYYTKIEIL